MIFPTVQAAESSDKKPERMWNDWFTRRRGDEKPGRQVKPSDLPVYEEPEEFYNYEVQKTDLTKLEQTVVDVHKAMDPAFQQIVKAKEHVTAGYKYVVTAGNAAKDYVMEEKNSNARIGVITVAGLTGFIAGRTYFRKLIYTTAGSVGVYSLIYPKEAKEYSKEGFQQAKKLALVGYNFTVGVKPAKQVPVVDTSVEKVVAPVTKPATKENTKKNIDETKETTKPPSVTKKPETTTQTTDPTKAPGSLANKAATSLVTGDYGQSNPEDRDMYPERSR